MHRETEVLAEGIWQDHEPVSAVWSSTLPGIHSFRSHTLHITVTIPGPGFMPILGPDEALQLVPAASLVFIHPQVYLLSATNCLF